MVMKIVFMCLNMIEVPIVLLLVVSGWVGLDWVHIIRFAMGWVGLGWVRLGHSVDGWDWVGHLNEPTDNSGNNLI